MAMPQAMTASTPISIRARCSPATTARMAANAPSADATGAMMLTLPTRNAAKMQTSPRRFAAPAATSHAPEVASSPAGLPPRRTNGVTSRKPMAMTHPRAGWAPISRLAREEQRVPSAQKPAAPRPPTIAPT